MKLVLTFLMLLLPAAGFAAQPESESFLKIAGEYFKAKQVGEQMLDEYQQHNKALLKAVMDRRPCIPPVTLDRYKQLGDYPAADFQNRYLERVMSVLTEDDLRRLKDFYLTHVGQYFVRWRREHSGNYSGMVPLTDKEDQILYANFQDVVLKEHAALLKLSAQPLFTEEEMKAQDDVIARDVEVMVQPYLDKAGNCK